MYDEEGENVIKRESEEMKESNLARRGELLDREELVALLLSSRKTGNPWGSLDGPGASQGYPTWAGELLGYLVDPSDYEISFFLVHFYSFTVQLSRTPTHYSVGFHQILCELLLQFRSSPSAPPSHGQKGVADFEWQLSEPELTSPRQFARPHTQPFTTYVPSPRHCLDIHR